MADNLPVWKHRSSDADLIMKSDSETGEKATRGDYWTEASTHWCWFLTKWVSSHRVTNRLTEVIEYQVRGGIYKLILSRWLHLWPLYKPLPPISFLSSDSLTASFVVISLLCHPLLHSFTFTCFLINVVSLTLALAASLTLALLCWPQFDLVLSMGKRCFTS